MLNDLLQLQLEQVRKQHQREVSELRAKVAELTARLDEESHVNALLRSELSDVKARHKGFS